jgi:hypothetical protein
MDPARLQHTDWISVPQSQLLTYIRVAILDPSLADPGGDIVHEIPIAPDKVGRQ